MNQAKEFFQYIFNSLKIWIIIQPWEAGLRVRNGRHVTKLSPGIYFRIPYFDSVYIQEARLRIADMPMQTATTKDLKTITLSGAIGYSINDVEKLYNTLYHPETSLRNIAMSAVAASVFGSNLADVCPKKIQSIVLEKLQGTDYGITFEYFEITNFAVVRTYRLIQDQNWGGEAVSMDKKK